MNQQISQDEDVILRRALFTPCLTKEDLHRWIAVYLGFNFPDTVVDPESNSSPMDIIWEVYSKALENNDPEYSRVMTYASRDSFKTLGAAILEILAVVHLDRDVAHMAAIKPQAKKAQSYVKTMFRMPYLRDFVVSMNTEMTEIVWYSNPDTGDYLNTEQYDQLLEADKRRFVEHARYIKIVVCSMAGANSDHVPFFVVDEVDVVPKQNQTAYQEAKSIPGAFDGKEPITLLISTRKFAFGNVQQELNSADKTGLVVRHWNIIDVTERCSPSRHLPDRPRIEIYHRRDDLSAISRDEWSALSPEDQARYQKDEGYEGCLSKCKLFAVCRGHLATRQKDHERVVDPKTGREDFVEKPRPLLKSHRFTTNKFKELTLDMAKAQLMCWQASREGLIYPNLSKQKHLLKPCDVAKKLTGEEFPANFNYTQLLLLMKERGGRWIVGGDFGYTHMFSVVLIYVDGYNAFVVGSWQQPELDPVEKVDLCERTIKEFNPTCYFDPEDPAMIKFLKKHGFRCPDWSKTPGSVIGGIETLRWKIMPTLTGEPQIFFVDGGPGVVEAMDTLMLYHWELGVDGSPTDVPDEVVSENIETGEKILDDVCDSIRYAIMNVFRNKGKVTAAPDSDTIRLPTPKQVQGIQQQQRAQNNIWAKQILEHAMSAAQQRDLGSMDNDQDVGASKGHKGGIFWEIG